MRKVRILNNDRIIACTHSVFVEGFLSKCGLVSTGTGDPSGRTGWCGTAPELPIAPGRRAAKLWERKLASCLSTLHTTPLVPNRGVAPDGSVYFSDITFSHLSADETGAFEPGSIWKYNPKTEPETTAMPA